MSYQRQGIHLANWRIKLCPHAYVRTHADSTPGPISVRMLQAHQQQPQVSGRWPSPPPVSSNQLLAQVVMDARVRAAVQAEKERGDRMLQALALHVRARWHHAQMVRSGRSA